MLPHKPLILLISLRRNVAPRPVPRSGRGCFDLGELRLVVLHLIAEKPRHGYAIIKALADRANGAYSPSPGVIYPTLTLLEELGFTALTAQDGKKLYTLIEAGEPYLPRTGGRSMGSLRGWTRRLPRSPMDPRRA